MKDKLFRYKLKITASAALGTQRAMSTFNSSKLAEKVILVYGVGLHLNHMRFRRFGNFPSAIPQKACNSKLC